MKAFITILFFLSLIFSVEDSNKSLDQSDNPHTENILLNDNDSDIPDYIDSDKILCKGKGFRVARCINSQLKKGKCLALAKEGKKVYVIEIDCNKMREEASSDNSIE